jgi:type IV secretory pathway VirB10-like protein
MMFKCFRRDDAADPQTFLDAAAAILADYPDDVIIEVTDPRTGIPSKQKWPPQPHEVKTACDAIELPRRARDEREKKMQDQLAERAVIEAARQQQKQTHDEFVAEMRARGMPMNGSEGKRHIETAQSVRTKFGLTEAQWDAIPDLPLSDSKYWAGERKLT